MKQLAETTTDFKAISIGLASPEQILAWSHGEVKKPETINYRTYKPERDGLFCERIFGPTKDWECHCGKYKKVKFKGIICDRCGVEVTRRKVRRERMGHIALASPVCHSWYLKGVPSPISLLLNMPVRRLTEVIYFTSYIVTDVDFDKLDESNDEIRLAIEEEKDATTAGCDAAIAQLRQQYEKGLNQQQATADQEEPASAEDSEDEDDQLTGVSYDEEALPEIIDEHELAQRIQQNQQAADERMKELDDGLELLFELAPKQLISEMEYRQLTTIAEVCQRRLEGNCDNLFKAGLGAKAVRELLARVDLDELAHDLHKEIEEHSGPRQVRAVKRLRVVEAFRNSKNRPEWMILEYVPVLPPELRPMVQLDGGRFATSDLNDLYRRVINRNNRLRRIIEINAPESIVNHERPLLQEAVDALIDNNRRSRPVTGTNRRVLKSLSDMLKGKEGRFRKNLLGKRVDYSGRAVIVVGPELKLHQCGLPREMALELFKPFVMSRLVDAGLTTNIKTAKRMVDRRQPEVWDALDEVIEDHPVLLNRAPTLHRLGIQAFEPVLIDGKAIQLHPLACQAFNADFDGDQMAVHIPLTMEAQAEARLLMLSSGNLFKPSDGNPIAQPLYDIVLGCYYLTQETESEDSTTAGKVFESLEAAVTAYEHRKVDLHALVKVRVPQIVVQVTNSKGKEIPVDDQLVTQLRHIMGVAIADEHPARNRRTSFKLTQQMVKDAEAGQTAILPEQPDKNGWIEYKGQQAAVEGCQQGQCPPSANFALSVERTVIDTTVGRVLFNYHLPPDLPYINHVLAKDELADLVILCYRLYGPERTAQLLDDIKEIGFKFATRAGVSISVADTEIETDREGIIARTEREVQQVNKQASDGIIAEDERQQLLLQLWQTAREDIVADILANIGPFNSIWMMVDSGARANRSHICQIAGMRGLMSDPFGRLIEDLPVRSNFHEGLNVLEYFVSTHGARKGLADTALRTADAGYLTRRLVDVAQDVIIGGEDCETTDGIEVTAMYAHTLYCPNCGREDHYRQGVCQYCDKSLAVPDDDEAIQTLQQRVIGRTAATDILHPQTQELIVPGGQEIDERHVQMISEVGIKSVTIRSPLTCELRNGVCAKCYGRDLSMGRQVDVGTAIGVIAAQSIGEPGTQLTMRTFHTGGVAGEYITGVADVKKRKQQALQSLSEDIEQGRVSLETVGGGGRSRQKAIREMLKVLESSMHGLLRVVELFEARTPKGQAITAQVDGVVSEIETKGLRTVVIHSPQPLDAINVIRGEPLAEDVRGPDGNLLAKEGQKLLKKIRERLNKAGVTHVTIRSSHLVPHRGELYVHEGTEVRAGDPLIAGPVDPEDILEMKGIRGVQDYLLSEIQNVYQAQGVSINDKHIETIIRQMLKRRNIIDHGDTRFLPGEVVDKFDFADENDRVRELGGRQATAEPTLLGITQASLSTDSFLSAASFQRTTRVLTEAACENKRDPLEGLKENVIIGRLIPAGTGMSRHRTREVDFSPDVREQMISAPLKTPQKKDAMQQLLEDLETAGGEAAELFSQELSATADAPNDD